MGRAGTKRMEERRYSNYTYVHGRSKYRQMPHRSASRADAALEARPAAATDLSALHHSMCAQFTMMVTLTRPVAHSAAARRSPPALECGTAAVYWDRVLGSRPKVKKKPEKTYG